MSSHGSSQYMICESVRALQHVQRWFPSQAMDSSAFAEPLPPPAVELLAALQVDTL